jgi:hypothetical protein
MSREKTPDAIRSDVLAEINRSENRFRKIFFSAVAFEMAFLIAFVLLADFSNRTHVLLLIAAIGTYGIVVLSLVAVTAQLNQGILRVLKALELLRVPERTSSGPNKF